MLKRKFFICTLLLLGVINCYPQIILPNSQRFRNNSSLPNDPIALAQKNLDNAISAKNWSAAAAACKKLAELQSNSSKFDEAINTHLLGITLAQRAGDAFYETDNLLGIGINNFRKYNYAGAMEYYLKALKLSSKINNPEEVLRINNWIGMLYKYLEDFDKAKEYLLPAYTEAKRLNNGALTDLLINLGNVEAALGNYRKSIVYYKAYLARRPSDPFTREIAFANLGKSFVQLNLLDTAYDYYLKSYEADDSIANPRGRAYNFWNFAIVFDAKGDYNQALVYETKCLELSKKYKIKSLEWSCYSLLANCYHKLGNDKMAYEYAGKYSILKDSIFARKKLEKISVLEATYRVEFENEIKRKEMLLLQRENQVKELQVNNLIDKDRISRLKIASLNKEKSFTKLNLSFLEQKDSLSQLKLENLSKATLFSNMKVENLSHQNQLKNLELIVQRRNQLLLIIGSGLIIIAFLFYYRRYRLKKLLELEKLRSNIAADFHDELGSTLSSIALYSEMALREEGRDTHRAQTILSQIGESSRSTVSSMNDMIWTIQPKNDYIGELVFRMREYAFPLAELKNILLSLDVGEDVKNIQTSMNIRKNLYLVFKEAVNNAFKYSSASTINVGLTRQNNKLGLEIKDDGLGFDMLKAKMGNGLKNMQKRAEQTNGKLIITSFPGEGTSISFTCPLS